ncbi:MAG: uracil-DNA glycosylase [Desulfobacterales bacterium]|nr:uracil-DNA glycosylase [Desulfobacterales bacterium]
MPSNPTDLLREVRQLLEYHRFLGITSYPRTDKLVNFLTPKDPDRPGRAAPAGPAPPTHGSHGSPSRARANAATSLAGIRAELKDCRRCRLQEHRSNIVFGAGQPGALLFLVADSPSPEEDRTGLLFSGEPGELLDRMLNAIQLTRDQVYLACLVKCASPAAAGGPGAEEINTCRPFLWQQIEAVAPRIVCPMGPLAARALTGSDQPLIRQRGRFHQLRLHPDADPLPVMPTFHPGFLLVNPEMKRASWEDLQMIRRKLKG